MAKRSNFCNELDRASELARKDENSEQLELIEEVKDYVKSARFTDYKKAKLLLGAWGLSDVEASRETGLKPDNIRVVRKKFSDALYERFGEDYISLLSAGDEESLSECRKRLRVVSSDKKASDYIPSDYIKEVRRLSSHRVFDLRSECRKEFTFLQEFSYANFRKRLMELDPNKVAYVLRVLNEEEGTLAETDTLRRVLESMEGKSEV